MRAEFKYRDSSGNIQTGYMTLDDYRLASQNNMTASSIVNARHADADPNFGSAFEQGMKYLGIFPKGDRKYGIMPTTIRQIIDGTCSQQLSGFQLAGGATIVSPKGHVGGSTPASRILLRKWMVFRSLGDMIYWLSTSSSAPVSLSVTV